MRKSPSQGCGWSPKSLKCCLVLRQTPEEIQAAELEAFRAREREVEESDRRVPIPKVPDGTPDELERDPDALTPEEEAGDERLRQVIELVNIGSRMTAARTQRKRETIQRASISLNAGGLAMMLWLGSLVLSAFTAHALFEPGTSLSVPDLMYCSSLCALDVSGMQREMQARECHCAVALVQSASCLDQGCLGDQAQAEAIDPAGFWAHFPAVVEKLSPLYPDAPQAVRFASSARRCPPMLLFGVVQKARRLLNPCVTEPAWMLVLACRLYVQASLS